MKRTGVKVCGITRVEDARLAVELGAEYLGLNFWPESPRFITPDRAGEIAETVRGRVQLVGVWVDPLRDEVAQVDREVGLDLLQFHGDDHPEAVSWFPDRVIRAIRVDLESAAIALGEYGDAWGFLFDCAPSGVFGGTGKAWPYERIAGLETSKPVIVAGGLTPENVAMALARSRAAIVDVCSGVEAEPGIKDPGLLERFLSEVRDADTKD